MIGAVKEAAADSPAVAKAARVVARLDALAQLQVAPEAVVGTRLLGAGNFNPESDRKSVV